eukprot:628350-Rhodomonas_salina.1
MDGNLTFLRVGKESDTYGRVPKESYIEAGRRSPISRRAQGVLYAIGSTESYEESGLRSHVCRRGSKASYSRGLRSAMAWGTSAAAWRLLVGRAAFDASPSSCSRTCLPPPAQRPTQLPRYRYLPAPGLGTWRDKSIPKATRKETRARAA